MAVDDPFDVETFLSWAAHEAAHAVVTVGLGIPVCRVLVAQLSSELKLGYSGWVPKEDCSHSQPDSEAYVAALPVQRCLVARAGEVGQRLYTGGSAVLSRDQWSNDADEVARESALSGAGLEEFLAMLGDVVQTWLNKPGPQRSWHSLRDALLAGRGPHPGQPAVSFRSVLEGDPLQELLAGTPAFPMELLPVMPTPAQD